MTRPPVKSGFASRPGSPDSWVRATDAPATSETVTEAFTVAVMLRELLVREFPPTEGDQP